MNESKTPFSEGWLETSRDDNKGIKISHYFKNEKCLCGKYEMIPANVIANDSPSIHCKDCEDKMKEKEDVCEKESNPPSGSQEDFIADEEKDGEEKAEQDSEMKHDNLENTNSQP